MCMWEKALELRARGAPKPQFVGFGPAEFHYVGGRTGSSSGQGGSEGGGEEP